MSTRKSFIAIFVAFALHGPVDKCYAGDRYFMLIFGSQTNPFTIRLTHTFGIFVKASGENPDLYQLETQTISWMPQNLTIRPLALAPEKGVNLDLANTIRWANSVGAYTTLWGPFEIKKELYDMAARQVAVLNAGNHAYMCNDRRFRGAGASNCIHAVADLDTTQTQLMTGTQSGNAGSGAVLQHLYRYVLPTQVSNLWVLSRLKIRIKQNSGVAESPALVESVQ